MRTDTLGRLAYERFVLDPLETIYEVSFYPLLIGIVAGPLLFGGTFFFVGFWKTPTSFALQGIQLPVACLAAGVLWFVFGLLVGSFGLLAWMADEPVNSLPR